MSPPAGKVDRIVTLATTSLCQVHDSAPSDSPQSDSWDIQKSKMLGLLQRSDTTNHWGDFERNTERASGAPSKNDTGMSFKQGAPVHPPSLSTSDIPAGTDYEHDLHSSVKETSPSKAPSRQSRQLGDWADVIERFNERVAFDGMSYMGIYLEKRERFEDLVFMIAAATHSIVNQRPNSLDERLDSLIFSRKGAVVKFPIIHPLDERFRPFQASKRSRAKTEQWQDTIAYLQAAVSECMLPETLVNTLSLIATEIQEHQFSRYFLAKTSWRPEEEDEGIDSLLRWWAATDNRLPFCQEFHSEDNRRKRFAFHELNDAIGYIRTGEEATQVSRGLDDIGWFRRRIMAALAQTFDELVEGARRLGLKAEIEIWDVEVD